MSKFNLLYSPAQTNKNGLDTLFYAWYSHGEIRFRVVPLGMKGSFNLYGDIDYTPFFLEYVVVSGLEKEPDYLAWRAVLSMPYEKEDAILKGNPIYYVLFWKIEGKF
jgi:hypothetical protein